MSKSHIKPPLNSFLRSAVIAGVESAVQIHIDRGDELNAYDLSGMTPLMLSAARNKPAVCELLLKAGADSSLQDISGKTALEIAIATGSQAVVNILKGVKSLSSTEISVDNFHEPTTDKDSPLNQLGAGVMQNESIDSVVPKLKIDDLSILEITDDIDIDNFDLGGWVAESESIQPEVDVALVDSASSVQANITAHESIDSSAYWDEIDVFLPDSALPLSHANNEEERTKIRHLFLRAIREGSVPCLEMQERLSNTDRYTSSEKQAFLTMLINDLGAELDERIEYINADENFKVFIDPDETPGEEALLDEVMEAIDCVTSSRNEPVQIYQREFQRLRLLSADEEIQLAKDMEFALDAALDALAAWPEGIVQTLAAGADVRTGLRPFASIFAVEKDPNQVSEAESNPEEQLPAVDEVNDEIDEEEGQEGDVKNADKASFFSALDRLALLAKIDLVGEETWCSIREELTRLKINRRFLLELIDIENTISPCFRFRSAMDKFRKARDSMASANLKLVFFHAKKYLYSGEPLDDLAQEGNIGLLKAVDRYDWRRGFRFSTYATWWIRQQIGRYIAEKNTAIRTPVHIYEKIQRMERTAILLETELNRKPTLDELATRMDMLPNKVVALQKSTPKAIDIDSLSFEEKIAMDTNVLSDPADVLNTIQINQEVDRLISSLSVKGRKEEFILRMRYGIGVSEVLTLDQIGVLIGVTRERIRQIESKAIKNLRHPARMEPFIRQVLGIKQREEALISKKQDSKGIGASTDFLSQNESVHSANSLLLDGLIAQATELGIPVNDERMCSPSRVLVTRVDTSDEMHRSFALKLLEYGFSYTPGKGYWL